MISSFFLNFIKNYSTYSDITVLNLGNGLKAVTRFIYRVLESLLFAKGIAET